MASSSKLTASKTIYILYWILLTYIIAALIWWFIALNQQNNLMTTYKLEQLDPFKKDYTEKVKKINGDKQRKAAQYIGEGATFFLLIIAGAVFVFRAVRRQFIQSQQQQNFMMAVTHELKTPIAVTKLNLETLQKHKLSEEQQQRLISNTLQEANRLNSLCNNLLLAGQIESGNYQMTSEKFDLQELTEESIQEYATRFPDRIIGSSDNENIFLTGDKLLLKMVINNILDNAIKYSPKEEKIFVSLKKEEDKIKIQVADNGKGIPDEEKEKIFRKFYRGGNEFTKAAKGTGLGLFLAKKIIQQHGGTISAFDNTSGGSIFEIVLKNE